MEFSMMSTPINSGLSDAEPCEAGHYLPCTVCGAKSYDRCNGGQYVSPGLRAVPRTLEQAQHDRVVSAAKALVRLNRAAQTTRFSPAIKEHAEGELDRAVQALEGNNGR